MELERRFTKPKVASSSLAKASTFYFGVIQLAGRLTLNQETKVQILSPKPNFLSLRVAKWIMALVLGTRLREFDSLHADQTSLFLNLVSILTKS